MGQGQEGFGVQVYRCPAGPCPCCKILVCCTHRCHLCCACVGFTPKSTVTDESASNHCRLVRTRVVPPRQQLPRKKKQRRRQRRLKRYECCPACMACLQAFCMLFVLPAWCHGWCLTSVGVACPCSGWSWAVSFERQHRHHPSSTHAISSVDPRLKPLSSRSVLYMLSTRVILSVRISYTPTCCWLQVAKQAQKAAKACGFSDAKQLSKSAAVMKVWQKHGSSGAEAWQ